MKRITLFGLAAILATPSAQGQVLLSEDFNGTGNIDTSVFRVPFGGDGSFLGRTQLVTDPAEIAQQVNGAAVLELNTFFDGDPGGAFLGDEIITRRNFAVGGGLSVEYRARIDGSSIPAGVGGVINGLFLFSTPRVDGSGTLIRDEIDVAELLTNEVVSGQNRVLTNVFSDEGFTSAGNGAFAAPNLVDLTQFNDYRVDWTPDSVDFFINGQLVRSETNAVPNEPQTVRANIHAFNDSFAEAFDAALQPAASAEAGQTIRAEIDSLQITRFDTELSDNLLVNGGFEDSTDIVFNTSSLTVGQFGSFNNASIVEFGAEDSRTFEGERSASLFGTFGGAPDASGLFQDVAAEAGQEFEVSAQAITISADSILGTQNFATLSLQFLDANGDLIDSTPGDFTGDNQTTFAAIDGRDVNAVADVFLEASTSAIAPEDTAFVRVQALFATPTGLEGGAVQFDNFDLRLLTAIEAELFITGDYNGDGFVGQQDLDLVLLNFGDTELPDGFEEGALAGGLPFDGLIGQDELDGVLLNFGDGTAVASANLSAVPEPATAALLLVGGVAMTTRRRRLTA